MKLIPKAIAYSKNVNAIENHSFQAWLSEKVEKEDLIWWAQQPDKRELREEQCEVSRWDIIGQLKALIP